MEYLFVVLGAYIAGFLQGSTGFGAVMIMMMILPFFYDMAESVGISTATTLIGNLVMTLQYKRDISIKKILIPAAISILINLLTLSLSTNLEQKLLKKCFGVFLILLAAYYILYGKGKKWTLSPILSIVMVIISAVCNALFGIGGPLMAIYFMNISNNRSEYLGNIQSFFLLTGTANLLSRLKLGILRIDHIIPIMLGMLGIVLSGQISKKFVDKMNIELTEKLTYCLVAFTGLYNLLK